MELPKVDIYSDWWARPNPGPGWYWVVMNYKWIKKEFSWFEDNTTNNRMELTWAITWLKKLKTKSRVNLYTDSQYTINGIEKWWAKKWKANNWMRTKSEKAINYDLWEKLLDLVEKHEVKFHWVKWHNGHEENERCDELATEEILKNSKKGQVQDLPLQKKCRGEPCAHPDNKQKLIQKVLNENVDKSIKITKEWQACRKCWTKVEKRIPKKKNTKNKSYYYKFYLMCPWCNTNYFVDEAKVLIK